MKLNFKERKGITLIALVITIIVLLILAGVTIATLTGENGILTRATNAKEVTGIGKEKEIINLTLTSFRVSNKGKLNLEQQKFEEELNETAGTTGITAEPMGEKLYIVTFPDSGRKYEVYTDGTIEEEVPKITDKVAGWEETGDENDPYRIQSIEDLVELSKTVNAGESYEGKTFSLEVDLDFLSTNSYIDATSTTYGDLNGNGTTEQLITELTTGKGFTQIGYVESATSFLFEGNIEGNGHMIKSLYINNDNDAIGFIGAGTNNTIKDLELANVNITSTEVGYSKVGGVIGYLEQNLKIENCSVSGKIEGSPNSNIGGFVGYSDMIQQIDIINSTNIADITGNYAGGILGYIYDGEILNFDNCKNSGNVNGKGASSGILGYISNGMQTVEIKNSSNNSIISGNYSAGLAAYLYNVETINLEDCINEGEINGTIRCGGVLGEIDYCTNLTVKKCENTGNLTGGQTGGIIGCPQGRYGVSVITIEDCRNTGDIVSGNTYCGGIVSEIYNTKEAQIKNCYNTGNVDSTNSYVGGITGRIEKDTTITDCYNTGIIKGDLHVGGIFGGKEGSTPSYVTYCYNKGEIYGNRTTGGIGGNGGGSPCTISNCYNIGKVTGTGNEIGGITGNSGIISFCYNDAIISGNAYVAGITGYTSYQVDNTYNLADITGNVTDYSYAGGIAGRGEKVTNSYNLGKITGSQYSGGICGYTPGMTNCYNIGKVISVLEGQTHTGGIAGHTSGANLSTNYYLKSTYSVGSGDDEDTAISKDTETEMKTLMNSNLATITGWKQVSGGYPVFDTTNN